MKNGILLYIREDKILYMRGNVLVKIGVILSNPIHMIFNSLGVL